MTMKLEQRIGFWGVFSIAVGAMISSGLFVLPALAFQKAGYRAILAYGLASILVIPALFSKAELSTAMPKSGGSYFFIHRSLGPLFGTFAGISGWFSLSLKSAFALLGIGIFLAPMVPNLGIFTVKGIAIFCVILFTAVNLLGSKESARFQIIFVIILLLLLSIYIVAGLVFPRPVPYSEGGQSFSILSFLSLTGMIFVSYGGLTKVASIAEEVNNPGRNIPLGMISAYIVVSLIYLLAIDVTYRNVATEILFSSEMPLSAGGAAVLGGFGFIALSIAGLLAFITTGNAGLLAASRSPFAMAEDNLIPRWFAKVDLKRKTPTFAVLLTSVFMISVLIFLDLENLVKVASTMKLILFALTSVSVIMIRALKLPSYRPVFTSPGFPWVQIIGVVVYLTLIPLMGLLPILVSLIFFAASVLWYLLYSKNRIRKDDNLIEIAGKAASDHVQSSGLQEELKNILMNRDGIIEDRFDLLIKDAPIIHIAKAIDQDELFTLISDKMASSLGIESSELLKLLLERENQSSTVISKGLAIPHVIIPGSKRFIISVYRIIPGVTFTSSEHPVQTVFFLAGSADERNFHLQALMAIAQIVQQPEFNRWWQNARNESDLRDILLLSERIRKGGRF
jgi:APA family basic amino acid/polyamine antiporter